MPRLRQTRIPPIKLLPEDHKAIFEEILQMAPQALEEARNFMTELDSKAGDVMVADPTKDDVDALIAGFEKMNLIKRPVLPIAVNVATIFRKSSIIDLLPPERFEFFRNDLQEDTMMVLPLPIILKLVDEIPKLIDSIEAETRQRRTVERYIGPMGGGKSYACLAIFLASLSVWRSILRVLYIPNPVEMMTSPHLILEILCLVFFDSNETVLRELERMYIQAASGIEFATGKKLVLDAISCCRDYCNAQGLFFFIIMDQENALHSTPGAATYLLARALISGSQADFTILVSSATSRGIWQSDGASISNNRILIKPLAGLARTLFSMLANVNKIDVANFENWARVFDGEDELFNDIDEKGKGSPLDTRDILRYFSATTPSSSGFPWSEFFFEGTSSLRSSHESFMFSRLGADLSDVEHQAYSLILSLIDLEKERLSLEEIKEAGVLLWANLSKLLNISDPSRLKHAVYGLIDARFITIDYNEVPETTSLRASFVIRSLPETFFKQAAYDLMKAKIGNLPILQLEERVKAIQGYSLEY